jgi:hypothetical protein
MKHLYIYTALFLFACNTQEKKEVYSGSAAFEECKKQPSFVPSIGFSPQISGFSTSEKKVKGLAFIQFSPNENTAEQKIYQHPSWKSAGFMGPMALDDLGNIYIAPVPMVNVLENQPEKQNIIYKVDTKTQEMRPLINLPSAQKPSEQNAYGLLGMVYDCRTRFLYASSVLGSDREKEVGRIYSIDIKSGKIIAKLENIDAMGVGINYLNQKNRVFFGKARVSEIWSVEVDKEGKFIGEPRLEINLEDLGPRGDDKARKIRFAPNGDMLVQAINFYFNLTAPTEKQETTYTFRYDIGQGKWLEITK